MELDLASLQSVQTFVEEYKKKGYLLHILLNNAAVMACPYTLSTDEIELQFATNHLVRSDSSSKYLANSHPCEFKSNIKGHFLLTTGLLDVIENSAPARIVNVSSVGHQLFAPKEVRALLCFFVSSRFPYFFETQL